MMKPAKFLIMLVIGVVGSFCTGCYGQNNAKDSIAYDHYLKKIILDALTNKTEKQILVDTIIPDRKTAISVAEAILFKVYGKQTIIKEQPYSVDLIDGYWILQGDT